MSIYSDTWYWFYSSMQCAWWSSRIKPTDPTIDQTLPLHHLAVWNVLLF